MLILLLYDGQKSVLRNGGKMKIKLKTITKRDEGVTYKFKRGVAVIPDTYFQGRAMTITLKEFNEFKRTGDIK